MEASDQGAVGAIVDAPAAVVAPTAAAPAGDSAPVRSSGRKKPVGAPAAAAAVNPEKGPRGPYKKGKLQNGNTNIDLTVVHNKQEKKLASADELGAIAKLEAKNQGLMDANMRMSARITELVAENKVLEEKVLAQLAQMKSADAMVELAVTSAIMKEKAEQEKAVNSAYKSGQRDAMEQMQAMRKLFGS
ncbi:hypothetical protein AB1Y20_020125 [Prymnesium parvum]|uniref:Uncharacterized protein n=1 Tax=Prymnesium parvum TaxID=97485 RepID=A0AB34JUA6_PRYPA